MTRHALFVMLFSTCASPLVAVPPMVFPGRDWQTATPESQGVDSGKLR